jgi:DNA polymerase-3 subunit epsilon
MRPTVTARAPSGHGAPLARAEPTRLGLAEAGSGRPGSGGLGTAELRAAELRTAELGTAELGTAEQGAAEQGAAERGAAEVELGGLGLAHADLAEVEFAVIDLETTGWSPEKAAITEIAAVRVCGGRRLGEFASLVNPGVPVPPGIEDLTGISDWMLAAAPKLAAVLPGLLDFAEGCVLVAHNAPFDVGFLIAACAECGLAWPGFTVLDTVMLARRVMDPDEVPDCKLGTLAAFFRARTAPSHRALADARATTDVLRWLIRRLAHRGVRTLGQLSDFPDVVA